MRRRLTLAAVFTAAAIGPIATGTWRTLPGAAVTFAAAAAIGARG